MKVQRVLAVIEKEVREIARDPVIVAVSLLLPIIMLLLYGYAITLDVKEASFGVWDQDRSPASRELVESFSRTEYFRLIHDFRSEVEMETALRRGSAKLALVIPEGFDARLARGEPQAVQVIVDGSFSVTAQIIGGYADAIIAEMAGYGAAIRPQIRIWYNAAMLSVNYIIPGLFGVILMAFPPLLTALSVVREKETGSVQQIFASPLKPSEFILGKLAPYGGIAFLQMLLVLSIGIVWFEVPFRGNPGLLLAIGLLYVFGTVAIGLLVSTLTSNQVAAMLLALILTLMPSVLFSGFLFPIFTMPYVMQLYTAAFPSRYFIEISRDLVMKGAGFSGIWQNTAVLLAYSVAVFSLAAWRFRKKVA